MVVHVAGFSKWEVIETLLDSQVAMRGVGVLDSQHDVADGSQHSLWAMVDPALQEPEIFCARKRGRQFNPIKHFSPRWHDS